MYITEYQYALLPYSKAANHRGPRTSPVLELPLPPPCIGCGGGSKSPACTTCRRILGTSQSILKLDTRLLLSVPAPRSFPQEIKIQSYTNTKKFRREEWQHRPKLCMKIIV